jgi:hypothetical protein
MPDFTALAGFMYGDALQRGGFWYSHPLREVEGLTREQLLWRPSPHSLCALWQVGHIAHRERLHIGVFLQGMQASDIIPARFGVFGHEWAPIEQEVWGSVSTIQSVLDWARQVREESRRYIASLTDEDLAKVPPQSEEGLSVAHWLFITACHTALHIGRIQMLRAMIEGTPERAC